LANALGVILLFIFGSAQAALIDRGGGFIYDDVLDITWTQNANINGQDNWDNQIAWADSLSIYDSVRNVTWDDWRLASVDVNGDDTIIYCKNVLNQISATELACRDNELGYMDVYNAGSLGEFTNIQYDWYWSDTEWAPNTNGAWASLFSRGLPDYRDKSAEYYAWAVRDGDVVPIPASVWLFGSALTGLGWIRRKQAA
jgi:hypothetical protein